MLDFGSADVTAQANQVEAINTHIHNNEPSAGVMDVTGEGGEIVWKNITTPTAHCAVANITTEPLDFSTTSTSTWVLSPVSGTLFATIVITNSGGTCNIAGEYPLEGEEVNATTNGSVISFETGEGELTSFGFPVTLAGSLTMSAGATGGTHHAIALT